MPDIKFISFIFLLSIAMIGCKKEISTPPVLSYGYFPTEKGKWIEYNVDSTYHAENDNNNDDSVYRHHFQIREEIDSSFIDGEGLENQVISRFHRDSTGQEWVLTNVWTQRLTSASAYRTENNIRFHKLSFPINSSVMWNGNDANTYGEEIYFYDFFHEPYSINSLDFDSAISIIQIDENNFVEKIYGNEIYAAGVGLVFKERDELGKKNGIVVKGLEFKMQATAFGN